MGPLRPHCPPAGIPPKVEQNGSPASSSKVLTKVLGQEECLVPPLVWWRELRLASPELAHCLALALTSCVTFSIWLGLPEFHFPPLSKWDFSTEQIFERLLWAQLSAGAGDIAKNTPDRIPTLIEQIITF